MNSYPDKVWAAKTAKQQQLSKIEKRKRGAEKYKDGKTNREHELKVWEKTVLCYSAFEQASRCVGVKRGRHISREDLLIVRNSCKQRTGM